MLPSVANSVTAGVGAGVGSSVGTGVNSAISRSSSPSVLHQVSERENDGQHLKASPIETRVQFCVHISFYFTSLSGIAKV